MAMLAEPRRRKKYNLCPRGKALYEDDTRFGTKMLEKMGWSKGRGLGANEDGSQEFVRVRFKNDAEGLGYENRDDQWTVHEEGFNGLLKELNGGSADDTTAAAEDKNTSASEDESRPMGFGFKPAPTEEEPKIKSLKENISGVSLEEASKTSKARVHYKKFTRGKDLSLYSEKDLANIFGKKAAEESFGAAQQKTATEEKAAEEEAKEVNPNFGGVQTVSTGVSVDDYFKLKMEKLKNRANGNAAAAAVPVLSNGAEEKNIETEKPEEIIESPKKMVKVDKDVETKPEQTEVEPATLEKKKKSKGTEIEPVEEEQLEQIEDNKPKHAKMEATKPEEKKKKSKHTDKNLQETAATEPEGKKRKLNLIEEIPPQAETSIPEPKTKNKKEKKSKHADNLPQEAAPAPPKEKKKRALLEDTTLMEPPPQTSKETELKMAAEEPARQKKNKKSKHADNLPQEEAPPKKKKKKSKHVPEEQPEAKTNKQTNVKELVEVDKPLKHKKNVSAQSEDSSVETVELLDTDRYLTHEELIEKRDSFNICTISSFVAEKFHIVNLKAFQNASLYRITGYGIDEDNFQLNVVERLEDASRIVNLWEGRSNKYVKSTGPRLTKKLKKHTYRKIVRTAKNMKTFTVL